MLGLCKLYRTTLAFSKVVLYIKDFIVKFLSIFFRAKTVHIFKFLFLTIYPSVTVLINVIVTFLQKKALKNPSDTWKTTENLDTIQINDVSKL